VTVRVAFPSIGRLRRHIGAAAEIRVAYREAESIKSNKRARFSSADQRPSARLRSFKSAAAEERNAPTRRLEREG
jgi:hypothetical protein